jgi:hypothetical protein
MALLLAAIAAAPVALPPSSRPARRTPIDRAEVGDRPQRRRSTDVTQPEFRDPGVQAVKLSYFADADSLYIDIDEGSKHVQLGKLVLNQLPSTVENA